MHEIQTRIEIDATPARVWGVLVDFPSHPEWNPFIRSIAGTAREGETLVVTVQPQGGKPMTFKPTVLIAEPDRQLRWRGRFLVPGLFDGEHYFALASLANGQTELVHGEKFSGLLVPMAKSSLDGGTRAGFTAMNEALKARAESA
jgi:hypothetical protein